MTVGNTNPGYLYQNPQFDIKEGIFDIKEDDFDIKEGIFDIKEDDNNWGDDEKIHPRTSLNDSITENEGNHSYPNRRINYSIVKQPVESLDLIKQAAWKYLQTPSNKTPALNTLLQALNTYTQKIEKAEYQRINNLTNLGDKILSQTIFNDSINAILFLINIKQTILRLELTESWLKYKESGNRNAFEPWKKIYEKLKNDHSYYFGILKLWGIDINGEKSLEEIGQYKEFLDSLKDNAKSNFAHRSCQELAERIPIYKYAIKKMFREYVAIQELEIEESEKIHRIELPQRPLPPVETLRTALLNNEDNPIIFCDSITERLLVTNEEKTALEQATTLKKAEEKYARIAWIALCLFFLATPLLVSSVYAIKASLKKRARIAIVSKHERLFSAKRLDFISRYIKTQNGSQQEDLLDYTISLNELNPKWLEFYREKINAVFSSAAKEQEQSTLGHLLTTNLQGKQVAEAQMHYQLTRFQKNRVEKYTDFIISDANHKRIVRIHTRHTIAN